MKWIVGVLGAALISLASLALAQVASAEVLGVDETRPGSDRATALVRDASVGEVVIRVRALDANGDPVEGADVSWTVRNTTEETVYVVGSSAATGAMLERAYLDEELSLDGGVTDAMGETYLVLDAMSAGDVRVAASVGGVAAETYSGGDMRVVWF